MGAEVEEAAARFVLFVVFVDVGVGNPAPAPTTADVCSLANVSSRSIRCGGGEDGAAFDPGRPSGSSGTKAVTDARVVVVVVVVGAAPPGCGRTRLGNNAVHLFRTLKSRKGRDKRIPHSSLSSIIILMTFIGE